jgi:hypothetical protein
MELKLVPLSATQGGQHSSGPAVRIGTGVQGKTARENQVRQLIKFDNRGAVVDTSWALLVELDHRQSGT